MGSGFVLNMADFTAEGHQPPTPMTPGNNAHRQKCIAALILPAGTGKSYFRYTFPFIKVKEADEVCMPREDMILSKLRTEAKRTGNWALYDVELAGRLHDRLDDGDLILVSSVKLAHALNANVLGVFVLTSSRWRDNMFSRGQDPSKHVENYEEARSEPSVVTFSGMASLCEEVKKAASDWNEAYNNLS